MFPLQLSLLCFAYCWFFFLFSLFACVSPSLFLVLPTSLTVWAPWKAAPTGGRQTPFPLGGVPALPRGGAGRRPPTCGRAGGGEPASCCHLLTRIFYRTVLGLFPIILRKKQEIADGTVILGGTEKVVACLGVLDQNHGVGWLVRNIGLESSRNLEYVKCFKFYQFLFYFSSL